MLPMSNSGASPPGTMQSSSSFFFGRLLDTSQWDIQATVDQMLTLCSTSPQRVYKTSYYRKQTKNYWARDDPAFVVLQIFLLFIASICYSIAFSVTSFGGFILNLIHAIIGNYLLMGVVIATLCRSICTRFLTVHHNHSVKQNVEWLYAFDIHCNSFFPLFMLIYLLQFFLLPVILRSNFFALLLSNALYAGALSWYWYISHLGYRALPFLKNTEVFLYPIVVILLGFVLTLALHPLGFSINIARILAAQYY